MSTTTHNPGWGFYGTMGGHAEQAWPIALDVIARQTGQTEADVGTFLDSTYGRHFADQVQDRLAKGDTLTAALWWVATEWQERRTGKSTPTLTAYVIKASIAAESE